MTGRTRKAANDRFRDTMQGVFACVARNGFLASTPGPASQPPTSTLALSSGIEPTALSGSTQLSLTVSHGYSVEQDSAGLWRVQTRSYAYHVYDAAGRRILGYHWHPGGRSRVQAPHLHVYVDESFGGRHLSRVHFLTGRIALEDVVEVLVEEFEVTPRRADWKATLHKTRELFEQERTWPRSGRAAATRR